MAEMYKYLHKYLNEQKRQNKEKDIEEMAKLPKLIKPQLHFTQFVGEVQYYEPCHYC